MVLDNRSQGGLVGDLADPSRQLTVPDQSVTTDELVVACREVDELISTIEVELALVWFSSVPLHRVLRCKLAELAFEEGHIVGIGEELAVAYRAPVLLSLGLELRVKRGRLAGLKLGGGSE